MDTLHRRALDILEIAASPEASTGEQWIACDARDRVMQLLTLRHGWSLPALALETGAASVYRVERRAGRAAVEGWSRSGSCSVARDIPFQSGRGWLPAITMTPAIQ